MNKLNKNVRGSSDVVRVGWISVYIEDGRDPAGPQVLDSSHLTSDGVVVRDRYGVGKPGNHLPTVAQSDHEGAVETALSEPEYTDDILKILIHR